MKHNYIKMALSVGAAAILAGMPVTCMAATANNSYVQAYDSCINTRTDISNTNINTYINSIKNINDIRSINNIKGINNTSNINIMQNAVNVSGLKNNIKVSGDDITVDADTSDWKNITERESDVSKISSWKAAIASDYSALYICYEGMTSSQWDYNYAGAADDVTFKISYADGTQGQKNNKIQFAAWDNMATAKDGYYGDIANAVSATINEAHGNTAGPYVLEAAIPMDFFANADFAITFAGTTVNVSDIQVLDGMSEEKETESAPVYEGITIDGSFKDWAAVTKYDAACPNEAHKYCLEQTAMVFDGDYVYIYIKDGNVGSASGAGTHSNGQYSIKTDLGNELVFQLADDGNINGIDDAQCVHVGKQWEIAVPKSKLPSYNKTISFGLYLTEPFISDVANIKNDDNNGSNKDNDNTGAGSTDIEYDGLYGDWDKYPHTTIQYATAGTHHEMVDAKGALYCAGSTLYGHVVTTMPEHLGEAGGEFMNAVTIKFNDNYSQVFYPRVEHVASDGSINWNTPKGGYSDGTYEFYLFSTDAWHNSPDINNTNDADKWYGKMIITVKDGKDECEFYLDLEKVADKLGCDASDFEQIDAQFGRLGQQWITTAGASSGAWLGLVLCVGVTAGVLIHQKKKADRQVS